MKRMLAIIGFLSFTSLSFSQARENATIVGESQNLSVEVIFNEFKENFQITHSDVSKPGVISVALPGYRSKVGFNVVDAEGKIIEFGDIHSAEKRELSFADVSDGTYFVNVMDGATAKSAFLTVQKSGNTAQVIR